MTLITLIGVGVYMIGHGVTKVPNTGMVGAAVMIVGGALVLAGGIV